MFLRFAVIAALVFVAHGAALAQCAGDPNCLFSTNFDAAPEWRGCQGGVCDGGQSCNVGAFGANLNVGNACTDHPWNACVDGSNGELCDPAPPNYQFYRSEGVSGGQACNISATSAEGLPAWGGSGKAIVHRFGQNGTSSSDCFMPWWDANNQYQDIWLAVSFRADPGVKYWFSSPCSPDCDMKMIRMGHFKGDGNGNDAPNFFNVNQTPKPSAVGRLNPWAAGANEDYSMIMARRCYNSNENSAGCTQGDDKDQLVNTAGTRYCANETGGNWLNAAWSSGEVNRARTCTPASAPQGLDVSQCTNDTTCSGALVPEGEWVGGGVDSYMAGQIFDGKWHTVLVHGKMNTFNGGTDWNKDGWMKAYIDGVELMSEGPDQNQNSTAGDSPLGTERHWMMDGVPPGGTPLADIPASGLNWVGIGGNTRGQWSAYASANNQQVLSVMYDNVCIATTRSAAEACIARFQGPVTPACQDGQDNDGDGLTDTEDPGCINANDSSEIGTTVCDNGVDDDGDGDADTDDPGCSGPTDGDETNCGDGVASGNESCDGVDLDGQDCTDFGFAFGAGLTCNAQCNGFNTSACSNDIPVASMMSFDEVDDYFRINDSADMTLAANSWTVGIYTRLTDLDGSLFQYAISNNTTTADNSLNLLMQESTGIWVARVRDGAGRERVLNGGSVGADGAYRLVVIRRDQARDQLELLYCTASGGCTVEANEALSGLAAIDGAAWNIGRRTDGDADRYFGGELGHLFIADEAYGNGQLENLTTWMDHLGGVPTTTAYLGGDLQVDRANPSRVITPFGVPAISSGGPGFVQPVCGNGDWEATEGCDSGPPTDFGDQSCLTYGFTGGALACNAGCDLDLSGCDSSGLPPDVENLERTDTDTGQAQSGGGSN